MTYTDIVQKTVEDLTKIYSLTNNINDRLVKAEQAEQVQFPYVQRPWNQINIHEKIVDIKYRYALLQVDKYAPGLSASAIHILVTVMPNAIQTELNKLIKSNQQYAFNEMVDEARRAVGSDPIHVGDKLIFQVSRKHSYGNVIEKIQNIGRLLNVCMNRCNPVTANHAFLEYMDAGTVHQEKEFPGTEVHKIKLFHNGKLKIWLYKFETLEFIGKLIREENKDEEFLLTDGTILKCP